MSEVLGVRRAPQCFPPGKVSSYISAYENSPGVVLHDYFL